MLYTLSVYSDIYVNDCLIKAEKQIKIFEKSAELYSRMVIALSIPTSPVWGFYFPHIAASTWYWQSGGL